jgi:hypothetical protein
MSYLYILILGLQLLHSSSSVHSLCLYPICLWLDSIIPYPLPYILFPLLQYYGDGDRESDLPNPNPKPVNSTTFWLWVQRGRIEGVSVITIQYWFLMIGSMASPHSNQWSLELLSFYYVHTSAHANDPALMLISWLWLHLHLHAYIWENEIKPLCFEDEDTTILNQKLYFFCPFPFPSSQNKT